MQMSFHAAMRNRSLWIDPKRILRGNAATALRLLTAILCKWVASDEIEINWIIWWAPEEGGKRGVISPFQIWIESAQKNFDDKI